MFHQHIKPDRSLHSKKVKLVSTFPHSNCLKKDTHQCMKNSMLHLYSYHIHLYIINIVELMERGNSLQGIVQYNAMLSDNRIKKVSIFLCMILKSNQQTLAYL